MSPDQVHLRAIPIGGVGMQGPVIPNNYGNEIESPAIAKQLQYKAKVLELISQAGKRLTPDELEALSKIFSEMSYRQEFSRTRGFFSPKSRPEDLEAIKQKISSNLYTRGAEIDPFTVAVMSRKDNLDFESIMNRLKALGIESFGVIEPVNEGLNTLWQIFIKREAR